jgi:hypothetical protein
MTQIVLLWFFMISGVALGERPNHWGKMPMTFQAKEENGTIKVSGTLFNGDSFSKKCSMAAFVEDQIGVHKLEVKKSTLTRQVQLNYQASRAITPPLKGSYFRVSCLEAAPRAGDPEKSCPLTKDCDFTCEATPKEPKKCLRTDPYLTYQLSDVTYTPLPDQTYGIRGVIRYPEELKGYGCRFYVMNLFRRLDDTDRIEHVIKTEIYPLGSGGTLEIQGSEKTPDPNEFYYVGSQFSGSCSKEGDPFVTCDPALRPECQWVKRVSP